MKQKLYMLIFLLPVGFLKPQISKAQDERIDTHAPQITTYVWDNKDNNLPHRLITTIGQNEAIRISAYGSLASGNTSDGRDCYDEHGTLILEFCIRGTNDIIGAMECKMNEKSVVFKATERNVRHMIEENLTVDNIAKLESHLRGHFQIDIFLNPFCKRSVINPPYASITQHAVDRTPILNCMGNQVRLMYFKMMDTHKD